MANMKLAFVQLVPKMDNDDNIEDAFKAMDVAKIVESNFLLFPEHWFKNTDSKVCEDTFVNRIQTPLFRLSNRADLLNIGLFAAYTEVINNNDVSEASLIDRFGLEVLRCVNNEDLDGAYRHSYNNFDVREVDINGNKVNIGILTGYANKVDKLYNAIKKLADENAEVIFIDFDSTITNEFKTEIKELAYRYGLIIAVVNYPTGYKECNGQSFVTNGKKGNSVEFGSNPYIYIAEVEL